MGANTEIAWATHTFNPWVGCTKVSAACDHCYAEAWAKRTGQSGLWAGDRRLTSDANWRQPFKWNKAARTAGERHRVFCASLADVFDNQVPKEWRSRLWSVIAECQHLDWLLLTKRPQNIAKMLPSTTTEVMTMGKAWPWPHVWLGTTAENQEEADRRIPILLEVPATVRFVSIEPLLGPIDFRNLRANTYDAITGAGDFERLGQWCPTPAIDWVIVGGESGGGARSAELRWFHDIVSQCQAAKVSVFVKQLGARPVVGGQTYTYYDGGDVDVRPKDPKGGNWDEWPSSLRVREFPR